jgi:hypothetical protein
MKPLLKALSRVYQGAIKSVSRRYQECGYKVPIASFSAAPCMPSTAQKWGMCEEIELHLHERERERKREREREREREH